MKQQQPLKPNSNGHKLRVINRGIGKVREAQKCLRDEQRGIKKKFTEVAKQCDELKHESEMIMKRTAITQLKLALIFKIFTHREAGDFTLADTLSHILREIVAKERANTNASLDAVKNEVPHKKE